MKEKDSNRKLSLEERKNILKNTQIDKDMNYSERLAKFKKRYGV